MLLLAASCGIILVMKIEDRVAEGIPVWKQMVEEAGGRYDGVQLPFGDAEPLVLFWAPFSSNPISLPVSQMTEENVKHKLGIKTVSKKTHVNLTRLDELVAKLRGTLDAAAVFAAQIEEEIEKSR